MTEPSHDILLIAGSPTQNSRSSALLSEIGAQLAVRGARPKQIGVRDFPAEDLLLARTESPSIATLLREVREAKALVFATPVYKAVYAGALKVIVDLIAPEGLAGKTVLGVATGKLDAHGLTVERAFSDLFQFFRNSMPLQTLFVLDSQLVVSPERVELAEPARGKFAHAIEGLAAALG